MTARDRRVYNRSYYASNRAAIRAQQRRYHETHPEVFWAARHRQRAKRYGLELVTHVVTREQLVARWGDRCIRCGGAFEVTDHLTPVAAGGDHVVENVVPSCALCNRAKRWDTDEQLIRAFRETRPA